MEASTENHIPEVVSVCTSDDFIDDTFPTPRESDNYIEDGESTQLRILRAENHWVRESIGTSIEQLQSLMSEEREEAAHEIHSLRKEIQGWQKKYEDLEMKKCNLEVDLEAERANRIKSNFGEGGLQDEIGGWQKINRYMQVEMLKKHRELIRAEHPQETPEEQKPQAEIEDWQKKFEDLEAEKACSEKKLENELHQIKSELERRKRHKQHCVRQLPDLLNMEIADPNSFAEQCKFYALQRHEFEFGLHREAVVRLLEHLDVDQMRTILQENFRKIQEVSELHPLISALWLSATF